MVQACVRPWLRKHESRVRTTCVTLHHAHEAGVQAKMDLLFAQLCQMPAAPFRCSLHPGQLQALCDHGNNARSGSLLAVLSNKSGKGCAWTCSSCWWHWQASRSPGASTVSVSHQVVLVLLRTVP